MDNDAFRIVARLDIPKSAKLIKDDIPDLEKELQSDSVKIKAELNTTESKKLIQAQLDTFINQSKAPTIKVRIDTSDVKNIQNVTNGLKNVQTQTNQTSQSIINLLDKFKNPIKPILNKEGIIDAEKTISQVQRHFQELGNVSVKGIYNDKEAVDNLDKMIVKIKNGQQEVRTLTFELDKAGKAFYLIGGTSDNSGVEKFITSLQKAQNKIQSIRTNLASSLKNIGTSYSDINGTKPVIDETHIKNLNVQYVHALRSIAQLKNADETTMASMKANAEKEIDSLKRMVKEYQNAEYAATSLRTKDLTTNKSIQTQELDRFINKISGSKQIFNAMSSDIIQLKMSLNGISDATSFTKFLNELDIAKAKFESLKTMYQTIGGYDKQLDKLAQDWQKQGIYAGNLKTTIESLKTSLLGVNTADGLTNWIGDFNTQIGAISQLPVKIAEYRNQLSSVKTEWDEHHTNVKSVENAFGKLGSRLGRIKKEAKFNEWVKDFENLVLQSNRLKTNLDSQVSTQNRIYEIQSKIAKLNPTKDSAEIARLNEKLSAEQKTLSNLQMQSNVYSNLVSLEQQEQYITEQTVKSRDKLLSATNSGVKQYQTTITNAITKLQGITNSAVFRNNASNSQVTQTKQDINSLITAYQNLATKLQGNITPAGLETVRTELTQLNARFNQATTTAKRFETELRNDNGAEKQAQRIALLKAQIDAYAKANPKAMKKFGDAFNNMITTLNSSPDKITVDRVAKQLQILRQEINNANLAGKTLWQTLKEKVTKFTGWMSMTYAISLVTRTIRGMIAGVIDLDTAIVDLRKTFKGTEADLENFYNSATQTAKEVGVSSKEIIEQAAAWSRLGYSSAEAAETMAKNSAIFKTISPGMDLNTATDGLVSMMKAFDVEANDVLDGIMSKVNIIGKDLPM